jgi:hypothetical protein
MKCLNLDVSEKIRPYYIFCSILVHRLSVEKVVSTTLDNQRTESECLKTVMRFPGSREPVTLGDHQGLYHGSTVIAASFSCTLGNLEK